MLIKYLDDVINLSCVVQFCKSGQEGKDVYIRFISEMDAYLTYEFENVELRDKAFDYILHSWKTFCIFCDLDKFLNVSKMYLRDIEHELL